MHFYFLKQNDENDRFYDKCYCIAIFEGNFSCTNFLQVGSNHGLLCNSIWYSSYWSYIAVVAISHNIREGAC